MIAGAGVSVGGVSSGERWASLSPDGVWAFGGQGPRPAELVRLWVRQVVVVGREGTAKWLGKGG